MAKATGVRYRQGPAYADKVRQLWESGQLEEICDNMELRVLVAYYVGRVTLADMAKLYNYSIGAIGHHKIRAEAKISAWERKYENGGFYNV